MTFNEARLLDRVAYGSEFGHEYNTRIDELRSGVERRNAEWERALGRYAIRFQNLRDSDHAVVVAAHHACMGALIGFRLKDWSDYQADGEPIGFGAGELANYQLQKTYTFGSLSTVRAIYKPVQGTVQVFSNGVPVAASVDYTTGVVQVNAPLGEELTWTGEFDTPVRFSDDRLTFSIDNRSGGPILNSDVELQEIRL
ncbi:DUF2460 domain-containing protein [Microbulbifer thermotolerans]|uniref:DUF2460 domain-containing protein n=1 Tax=Microbulbifer thermotolerans TaxID=252514 RepID=UPI002673D228|nr:DUF2460 domain-containing protein [Microbulbifer thermotolerans]WKT59102.1 DUF2460 domain-containing protein [Microbulbifer thermotolerans]